MEWYGTKIIKVVSLVRKESGKMVLLCVYTLNSSNNAETIYVCFKENMETHMTN